MIQRKQTLFLLAAIIATVVCLCLPIGTFEPKGMGVTPLWYNLGTMTGGKFQAHIVPFVFLALGVVLSLAAIFMYKNRKAQARICSFAILMALAWYVYYCIAALSTFQSLGTFHPKFAACLPLVAIIFLVLARKGIKADEELVKSMDRIR
jgi:hypothetical protein